MPRRVFVPYFSWPNEMLDSINVNWPRIESVISKEINQIQREIIIRYLRFFAACRKHAISTDGIKEFDSKIKTLKQSMKNIENISKLEIYSLIRHALGNQPQRFDWDALIEIIENLNIRIDSMEKEYSSWKNSRPSGIGHFHMFISACKNSFEEFEISVSSHKNIDRSPSMFVDYCWELMQCLPRELREHASSKITLATEINRSLNRARR